MAWRVNVEAVKEAAIFSRKAGALMVFYSTDYVFDGKLSGRGYLEDDTPCPISRYGESKLGGEQAVAAVGGRYALIRLSRLFGAPALSASAKTSFFAKMMLLG